MTSRASAIQTSAAPSTLSDPASLAAFDLVVIGAPDVFGDAEAAAYGLCRVGPPAVGAAPALVALQTTGGTWNRDRSRVFALALARIRISVDCSATDVAEAAMLCVNAAPTACITEITVEPSRYGHFLLFVCLYIVCIPQTRS